MYNTILALLHTQTQCGELIILSTKLMLLAELMVTAHGGMIPGCTHARVSLSRSRGHTSVVKMHTPSPLIQQD